MGGGNGFTIFAGHFNRQNWTEMMPDGRHGNTPAAAGRRLELSGVRNPVVVLPVSVADRTWIWRSAFELLILLTHLYRMTNSGADLGFVKRILLDALPIASHFL